MDVKTIKIFGRQVTPDQANTLLKMHHDAFSQSACKSCPGLCCSDCAKSDGYLYVDNRSYEEEQALKKRYGWDNKLGFKTESGCSLPLHLRSTTCVSFYCENISNSNRFAREALEARRETVGPIPGLDVFLVSERVEHLHEKMREVFPR